MASPVIVILTTLELTFMIINGIYYKLFMIVNTDSRVVRITFKVVASPVIVILMTLESTFMIKIWPVLETFYDRKC